MMVRFLPGRWSEVVPRRLKEVQRGRWDGVKAVLWECKAFDLALLLSI